MKQVKCVYEQIVDILVEKIEHGELVPGDSIGSELTLAETFQVSRGTVCRALKQLEEMGYINISSRGKKRKVSDIVSRKSVRKINIKKIAVLFPDEREYFDSMIKECNICSLSLGWEVRHFSNFKLKGERVLIRNLIEERYDGVIMMPDYTRNDIDIKPILALKNAGIPFVLLCCPPRKLFCDAVYFDDYFVSFQMAELLKHMHCKEIIHITDSTVNSIVRKDRLDGYYDSVKTDNPDKIKVFDLHSPSDMKDLEYYLLYAHYKVGIHMYNNLLFQPVKKCLDNMSKKKGKDYEAISFYEKDFGEKREEMLVVVPKEKIIRRAVNILHGRLTGNTSENIIREIFCIEGLEF